MTFYDFISLCFNLDGIYYDLEQNDKLKEIEKEIN